MHANALACCQRKIAEHQTALCDTKSMLNRCHLAAACLDSWTQPNVAMWNLLILVEQRLERIIAGKEQQIHWVLKANKDRDEDEAWAEKPQIDRALGYTYGPDIANG